MFFIRLRAASITPIIIGLSIFCFCVLSACAPNQEKAPLRENRGADTPKPEKKKKPRAGKKPKKAPAKKPKNTFVVTGKYEGASPAGRWGERRSDEKKPKLAAWQQEQFDKLEAMGYVQGSQKASTAFGISKFDRKAAQDGVNFYVSGHAPTAVLMDMEGTLLHKWEFPFEKAWKKYPGKVDAVHSLFWRRAYLYENGDLLCIFEGMGMIKIDKNSKLIWKSPLRQHHDIEVAENGDIYTLTRTGRIIEHLNPKQPIVEDSITVLGPDGKVKKSVSLVKAMENSTEPMPYWDKSRQNKGDIFHTNTIRMLDGKASRKIPAFSKGRILISSFYLNAVFVVDLESEQVVWGFADDFKTQHDAQILPNQNLLLFDNQGGDSKLGGSRVLEYQLPSMKLIWSYEGNKADTFFTRTCGTVQRLDNGNTLITETDNGRAFEVTRKGRTVWEFLSPHRAGDDNELVASLFELKRFPRSYVKWLN